MEGLISCPRAKRKHLKEVELIQKSLTLAVKRFMKITELVRRQAKRAEKRNHTEAKVDDRG